MLLYLLISVSVVICSAYDRQNYSDAVTGNKTQKKTSYKTSCCVCVCMWVRVLRHIITALIPSLQ